MLNHFKEKYLFEFHIPSKISMMQIVGIEYLKLVHVMHYYWQDIKFWGKKGKLLKPLLLTWIDFNSNMDK